jgi:hypothetical protein
MRPVRSQAGPCQSFDRSRLSFNSIMPMAALTNATMAAPMCQRLREIISFPPPRTPASIVHSKRGRTTCFGIKWQRKTTGRKPMLLIYVIARTSAAAIFVSSHTHGSQDRSLDRCANSLAYPEIGQAVRALFCVIRALFLGQNRGES